MTSDAWRKLLVLIVLLTIGFLWEIISMLHASPHIVNFPPKGTTIVALGDSLTAGVGASLPEKGFIALLETRLRITIVNKGVSGNTTADGLARLDADVLSLHPDIVLVLLGSNDYLREVPQSDTFANLRTIIARIQKSGAVVILLGTRGGLLHDKFAADFATLADESGVAFVPNILDGIIGVHKYMSDDVHPNDAGYAKVADKIAPTLEGIVLSAQTNAP